MLIETGGVVFVESLKRPGIIVSLSSQHEEDASYDVFLVLVGGKLRNIYRFMMRPIL